MSEKPSLLAILLENRQFVAKLLADPVAALIEYQIPIESIDIVELQKMVDAVVETSRGHLKENFARSGGGVICQGCAE